ncbi:MAG: class II fructose-bisphosphate aldolase [Candidatus Harrisonbacteria bacterium]|nr:class II fructose-bisphosphate aldolase [Candidatus Harrisonbacteria bacterium]
MKTLKKLLKETEKKKVAIGHFNVAETSQLKAIFEVAKDLGVPVIIGTSEGEAGFLGRKQAVALVKSLREEYKFPIFLNSDHTKSFEEIKKAVATGYDAILFDGGTLPLAENIKQTKKVVQYVKSKNPKILVEGELGNIGSGSIIRKELPKGAAIKPEDLTKPEDAAWFVKETGVDMLAPAVGNLHGMFKDAPEPRLDIERIRAIRKAAGVPLVLHGGSGNTDEDFLAAIDAGVSIIHISTELRVAWRNGLEQELKENPEEIAPYRLLAKSVLDVKEAVKTRLKLFNKK